MSTGIKWQIVAAFLALALSIPRAYGCSCTSPEKLDDYEIEKYAHISLAKIKRIKPSYKAQHGNRGGDIYHMIDIQAIELFKGPDLKELFVRGGNSELESEIRTSCDIGMQSGEVWLLLVEKIGGLMKVQFCTDSRRFKRKDGIRILDDPFVSHNLRFLRGHYFPKIYYDEYKTIDNGIKQIRNATGQVEIEEKYYSGRLVYRKIWYPNGKIYLLHQIDLDNKGGFKEVYAMDGQLIEKADMRGEELLTQITYYPNGAVQKYYEKDTLSNTSVKRVYTIDGCLTEEEEFLAGIPQVLKLYACNPQMLTDKWTYKNGEAQRYHQYVFHKIKKEVIETVYEYDEHGHRKVVEKKTVHSKD